MDTSRPLKIAIVGAGAVGAYYGCLLARAGHDVHFLLRSDLETVRRDGYHITTPDTQFHLFPVNAHADTAEIGPCDLVIIALKATANAAFPALLPPLNDPARGTVFLTLQNGMGNVESLARLFPAENVLGGVCFVCINRLASGVVRSFIPGQIHLADSDGPARPRTHALAAVFAAAGAICKVVDSLDRALWFKLCWNIPFNSLAILGGGITTDLIIASPALHELVEALMHEVQAAAAAYGVEIPDKHITTQFQTIGAMGAYKPSSLIDFQEKRPVEVEAILGEPLRRGLAKGVSMGRLACVYALMRHQFAAHQRD
ncbi:MAG: 2-dehydropantoate 2-reductase [Puniceicoccales bacterium]|jgi:2-dehydropantoate 2-reductase|nr:2-dehydropantoate 2-reductase [Puniceicoccales bacterium]